MKAAIATAKKIFVLLACAPALSACLNLPDPIEDVKLEVSNVSYIESTVSATASISGSDYVSEWGIAVFSASSVEIARKGAHFTEGSASFSHTFNGVYNPQSCILKAYAIVYGGGLLSGSDSKIIVFGEAYPIGSASTAPLPPSPPSPSPPDSATSVKLVTLPVTGITRTTAVAGGNITEVGRPPYIERGVCYSGTSGEPNIENHLRKPAPGEGAGEYTVTLTGLTEGATYYVRAYAINDAGVAYGQTVNFTAGETLARVGGDVIVFEF
jgi:hypothetical protein